MKVIFEDDDGKTVEVKCSTPWSIAMCTVLQSIKQKGGPDVIEMFVEALSGEVRKTVIYDVIKKFETMYGLDVAPPILIYNKFNNQDLFDGTVPIPDDVDVVVDSE